MTVQTEPGLATRGMRTKAASTLVLGIAVLVLSLSEISAANAVVCAAGVYRAGCAGRHGAVVAPRPGHNCYWRAGVRICR
jgi:hypothetical protein